MLVSSGVGLLAPHPTPKPMNHSLLAVCDCSFNIFHSYPPSANLRTCHVAAIAFVLISVKNSWSRVSVWVTEDPLRLCHTPQHVSCSPLLQPASSCVPPEGCPAVNARTGWPAPVHSPADVLSPAAHPDMP